MGNELYNEAVKPVEVAAAGNAGTGTASAVKKILMFKARTAVRPIPRFQLSKATQFPAWPSII
ncbi:MAG: hypothetical protein II137_05895 [Anaerovibrio sp.]|uniref:hypothetical protein n=1 Tax=uncultured Anaerovibrio sp. TaxID=361586 RepID=UPI002605BF77|nr:hypothetical protein [uncultured Anaerovibrio sp.]MBQ1856110.1 hypothetical protein [Anaerovibrio sp.]